MQYQSHITLPNDVQATTELGMFVDEPKPTMNNSSLLSATAAPPSTLHKRPKSIRPYRPKNVA